MGNSRSVGEIPDYKPPSYASTGIYKGEIIDGKPDGIGEWVNSNSATYKGNWAKGIPDGKDFEISYDSTNNKNKFKGPMKDGVFDGIWLKFTKIGEVFEQNYSQGALISEKEITTAYYDELDKKNKK